jgi:radical SAM superfamily enzyme YgiQ (UPF0313 family)
VSLPILLLDVSHDYTLGVEQLSDWVQLPVGLLWLSASLRERFTDAVTVKVIDLYTQPGHLADVPAILRELRPRLVGLRALSPTVGQLRDAARVVKEWDPTALVVAGGPCGHAERARLFDDPHIDAVCPGEGERVICDVVERLRTAAGGAPDLRDVPGLLCRHDGQVHEGPPAAAIDDLDSLPFPDYRDLDVNAYVGKHPHTAVGRPYASLICSRGCPYSCIFCHAIFGRRVRHRSPANVAAEVRQLHDRFGIRDFILGDDAFNVNLPWAKEVFRRIAALAIRPRLFFSNGLRGDIWDDELLDLMVAAGVAEVVYAVESAAPRIQQLLQKRLDIPTVEKAIVATAKRGIITNGFFMIGFPSETEEELKVTVDFVLRHLDDLDFPYLSVVRAFEGTPLHQVAREAGYSEEFLRHHADMPYGMQVRIQSEYNFLPNDVLKKARMQVAMRMYSVGRMKRVLARLRHVLHEDEITMKLANCMGATPTAAAAVVRRYDDGTLEGRREAPKV